VPFVRVAGVVLLAAFASAITPATVGASCAMGPLGLVVWPKNDASDVPRDVPIVVARYYVDGDTTIIRSSLAAAPASANPAMQASLRAKPGMLGLRRARPCKLRRSLLHSSDSAHPDGCSVARPGSASARGSLLLTLVIVLEFIVVRRRTLGARILGRG
jgi:hypothetical protein